MKAGSFAELARRGVFRRVEMNLKDLVFEAHEQGYRVLNYIKGRECVSFRTAEGPIDVSRSEFDRIHVVAVTLDEIGHIANALYGLLSVPERYESIAWTVSVDDLETIADVLDIPSEFVHYLERREALIRNRNVGGVDELGFLEHYLHNGLGTTYDGEDARVIIDPTSAEIDAFEFAKSRGLSTPKPVSRIRQEVRAFCSSLERSGLPGWLEAAALLLDLPRKVHRAFAILWRSAQRTGREIVLCSPDGKRRLIIRVDTREPIDTPRPDSTHDGIVINVVAGQVKSIVRTPV